jgi:hypothetical protein
VEQLSFWFENYPRVLICVFSWAPVIGRTPWLGMNLHENWAKLWLGFTTLASIIPTFIPSTFW